jgi:hypothetical protein
MKIKAIETNEIWIEFTFSSLDGDDMDEETVYAIIDAETQGLEDAGYMLDYDSELWSKEKGNESLFVEHSWIKVKNLDDKGD